jgi:hypothetical protein
VDKTYHQCHQLQGKQTSIENLVHFYCPFNEEGIKKTTIIRQ